MNDDDDKLKNVNAVLLKMRDIFKCQMCSQIKDERSTVFYWGCQHCYCVDCIDTGKPCIVCHAANGKKGSSASVKLTENENILGIYRSVVGYKGLSQFLETPSEEVERSRENSRVISANPVAKDARSIVGDVGSVLEQSVVSDAGSHTRKRKRIPNANKRNHKGETPLHVACAKGNMKRIQELFDAGASPNEKDNAGWTPLHDSVVSRNKPVVKFLLKNGAGVNIPGHENMTALHLSVVEGHAEITRLLVKYGADRNARSIYGDTPMDLVKKYELKDLEDVLLNTPVKFKIGSSRIAIRSERDAVLYNLNLSDEESRVAKEFAEKFGYKIADKVRMQHPTTHIIISESEEMQINWNVIVGVLCGCRVIKITWMKESLARETEVAAHEHEATDGDFAGFVKSRENRANQLPGLFSGCHFFFGGNFELYKTGNMSFLKVELKAAVESNGGVVLTRNPDPESLALEKTIPYHASPTSSIANTSYYIVYSKGSWDPAPKYNMSHMKTLPVEWLLASVLRFELVDPNASPSPHDNYLPAFLSAT